ncbi:hypothetical protein FKM82_013161 [Ascaphus truei]
MGWPALLCVGCRAHFAEAWVSNTKKTHQARSTPAVLKPLQHYKSLNTHRSKPESSSEQKADTLNNETGSTAEHFALFFFYI